MATCASSAAASHRRIFLVYLQASLLSRSCSSSLRMPAACSTTSQSDPVSKTCCRTRILRTKSLRVNSLVTLFRRSLKCFLIRMTTTCGFKITRARSTSLMRMRESTLINQVSNKIYNWTSDTPVKFSSLSEVLLTCQDRSQQISIQITKEQFLSSRN